MYPLTHAPGVLQGDLREGQMRFRFSSRCFLKVFVMTELEWFTTWVHTNTVASALSLFK